MTRQPQAPTDDERLETSPFRKQEETSMNPIQYRKKPVVVDAVQVTRENVADVAAWCGGRVIEIAKPGNPSDVYIALDIPTLEGVMRANTFHYSTWDGQRYQGGDYVLEGVRGEFYPIKPDIFRETYEVV